MVWRSKVLKKKRHVHLLFLLLDTTRQLRRRWNVRIKSISVLHTGTPLTPGPRCRSSPWHPLTAGSRDLPPSWGLLAASQTRGSQKICCFVLVCGSVLRARHEAAGSWVTVGGVCLRLDKKYFTFAPRQNVYRIKMNYEVWKMFLHNQIEEKTFEQFFPPSETNFVYLHIQRINVFLFF